jgi:hypothetical protein
LGARVSCVNKSSESVLHVVLSDDVRRDDGKFVPVTAESDESMDIQVRQPSAGMHDMTCSSYSTAVKTMDQTEREIAAVVELLLQNGADCNAVCYGGETALVQSMQAAAWTAW